MKLRTLAFATLLSLAVPIAAPRAAPATVDVNTASDEQLQTVRGIGPAIAARILAARASGPFRDTADLQDRVRGLGPVSVRRLTAAGLSVPSVRIRPVQSPRDPDGARGPEIIAGNPVVRAPSAAPVCAVRAVSAPAPGGAARHPKPKAPGPA